MFGRVIKRRSYTPCHNIVKACLGQNQFWSEATEYGIAKEGVAISLFEQRANVKVRSGLWIDLKNGFLGASPDGEKTNTPEIILYYKRLFRTH